MIQMNWYLFFAALVALFLLMGTMVREFAKALNVPQRQMYGAMRRSLDESDKDRRRRQRPRDIMIHVLVTACVTAVLLSMVGNQAIRADRRIVEILAVLYLTIFLFGVIAGQYIQSMRNLWDKLEAKWQRWRELEGEIVGDAGSDVDVHLEHK